MISFLYVEDLRSLTHVWSHYCIDFIVISGNHPEQSALIFSIEVFVNVLFCSIHVFTSSGTVAASPDARDARSSCILQAIKSLSAWILLSRTSFAIWQISKLLAWAGVTANSIMQIVIGNVCFILACRKRCAANQETAGNWGFSACITCLLYTSPSPRD